MEEYEMLSLRTRRKKPTLGLTCCFNGHQQLRADSFDAASSSSPMPSPTTNRMSPSSLKGRYKNLISRMARQRRHSSADFSYDPLSYSRNFQDNDDPFDVDDFPIRSFASRLPLSPPGSRRVATSLMAPQHHHALSSSSSPFSSSPCSDFRKATMTTTTGHLGANPRIAAVAEVRKSLEEELEEELEEIRREEVINRKNLDIPLPAPRTVNTSTAAAIRSYDPYDNEVSPALVASPTSRHVLVELC